MDGLFTQEDIDNRFYVMGLCSTKKCGQWEKVDLRDHKFVCSECGGMKYDGREARSIRSWNATKNQPKEKKPPRRANKA